MTKILLSIRNVQHISALDFQIDLESCKLLCLVGKNGAGKTTLIKAIQNLRFSDVFKKTAPDHIFSDVSHIRYVVDDQNFDFAYDNTLRSLNTRQIIPREIKGLIDVELPLPYGVRFNFFQSISADDGEIRRAIVLGEYQKPVELIAFLDDIYGPGRFDRLIEVRIKRISYYCILTEGTKYIREDYLSSGEFFLISLYRKIVARHKLIVIDEIDISLDAAAQSRLAGRLRKFCGQYQVNILFSSHSLALMQTLEDDELVYMANERSVVSFVPASYSFVKSVLFGFHGWDKYILTEDLVLKKFLEFLIQKFCPSVFYAYKIIYIGGGENVADLMRRNAAEEFFAKKTDVIAVLDGDQRGYRHARREHTYCIPFESVEKKIFADYQGGAKLPTIENFHATSAKKLYAEYTRRKILTEQQMFEYVCQQDAPGVKSFAEIIGKFLGHRDCESTLLEPARPHSRVFLARIRAIWNKFWRRR